MIVLYWVTEHFPDFEGNEEMTDFLDWFEARLLEDVSPAITCVCVSLLALPAYWTPNCRKHLNSLL